MNNRMKKREPTLRERAHRVLENFFREHGGMAHMNERETRTVEDLVLSGFASERHFWAEKVLEQIQFEMVGLELDSAKLERTRGLRTILEAMKILDTLQRKDGDSWAN